MIPLGDSVCRFNPIFGYGMSVAAGEAGVLNRLLDSRRDQAAQLDGLAQDYLSGIQNLLEAPWAVALTDFVYPQTRGASRNSPGAWPRSCSLSPNRTVRSFSRGVLP